MISQLDKKFQPLGYLENYESLILHQKYFECGNFEFHAPYELDENAKYIYDNATGIVGIVEDREFEGMKNVYSGGLLKSLLKNKVISKTMTYTNKTAEYIVKDLVRTFASQNIQVEPSENRGKIYATLQITGENLLEYTDKLLSESEMGADIDFNFETSTLTYNVFIGEDNTEKAPLSRDYENIYSFKYTDKRSDFKNFAYVAGEDAGKNRVIVTVDNRVGSEEKKEIWVDARDLQSEYDEGETKKTLTPEEYKQALISRGEEKLQEYIPQVSIEIDPAMVLQLGEKRLFKDRDIYATQRITEKITAYEEHQTKQTVVFGVQKLNPLKQLERRVVK